MLTLALTVALLVLPLLNHAEIYYIRPSVSTTCSMHPCYTLSVYAEHHHHHFKNITLQFLPGDHALDVNITTEKIQQLEIIGNSSEVIPTRVICSSNVGFAFRYISKVKVNGLAFISCARISRDPSLTHTYIPHYALYLESVLMTVIADCTFQDSYGSALVVIGSHVVLRGKNNFISNGRSCIGGGHDRSTQCDCYGGSVYGKRSSLNFSGNNSFTNNSAYEGGAIYIMASDMVINGNTSFTSNSAIGSGGGVTAMNSNVTLYRSACFTGNRASSCGGGISVADSDVRFNGNITFTDNSAIRSGGGITATNSDVRLCGSTSFSGNSVDDVGGGISVADSNVRFRGSTTFTNNSAGFGGGVGIEFGTSANVSLNGNTTFTGNSVHYGGGVFIDTASNVKMSFNGFTTFSYNLALRCGGGVFIDSYRSNVRLSFNGSTTFTRNSALYGGGLDVNCKTVNFRGNTTFSRNFATMIGGGFYVHDSDERGIDVTISGHAMFSENRAGDGGGGGMYAWCVNMNISGIITFTGNSAIGAGGGISIGSKGTIIVDGDTYDCEVSHYVNFSGNASFTENSAKNGGCIFVEGSTMNLEGRSNFNECSARENGGAFHASGIHAILNGYNIFDGNAASEFGGGLYVVRSYLYLPGEINFFANSARRGGGIYAPHSSLNFSGTCVLSANMAQLEGGGIFADGSKVDFCGNITVRNNSAKLGGGIYSDNNTWNIGRNIIEANIARLYGGGIYTRRTQMTLTGNSTFFANSAGEGGGIYATANSTLDFDGVNIFKANRARVSGGGVWLDYSYAILNGNNSIIDCFASYEGGGIFTYAAIVSLPGSNTFISNSATTGGAIHVRWSKVTITQSSKFKYNMAVFGGGIFTDSSTFEIHGSSIFKANKANYTGGGIYAARSILNFLGTSSIYISANHATRDGGGIYTRDGCRVDVHGSYKCEANSAGDTGGGISAFHSTLKIYGHNIFNGNGAETGGGLYAFNTTLHFPGDSIFAANTASNRGGGLAAVHSTLHLNGSTKLRSNSALRGGGMYIDSSAVDMDGSNCFVNDTAKSAGGAIHVRESVVIFNGNDVFMANSARSKGGSVFATHSIVRFAGNSIIQKSESTHGAAIALSFTILIFQGSSFITGNSAEYGGAIHSERSNLTFATTRAHLSIKQVCLNCTPCQRKIIAASRNDTLISSRHAITFLNNTALKGGALYLDQYSNFSLYPAMQVHFQDNQATHFGAAIFVADAPEPDHNQHLYSKILYQGTHSRNQCFLYILGRKQSKDVENPPLVFENNSAGIRGSILYGGLLKQCNFVAWGYSSALELFNIPIVPGGDDHMASSVSSDPSQLCFCSTNGKNCTEAFQEVRIFPGQDVAVSVIAIDQSDKPITTVVHANVTSVVSDLHVIETISYEVRRNCTKKRYSVNPMNSYLQVVLYPNHLSGKTVPLTVNVTFEACPFGFEQSNFTGECICDHRLWQFTNTCEIDTQSIERPGGMNGNENFWLGISYSNGTAIGFIHHPYCPLNYCVRLRKHISFTDLNEQCNFNRSGLLCGECRAGFSLVLGSSHCQKCSNKFLALLIPFALAGILLMILLSLLHLTVAAGTLHGLIFYANIVAANHHIFFPQSSNNPASIFIAWLNLDLGVQTCFYDGMDAYAKTWLQFLFPLYVWGIMGFLVFVSDRSTRMTKLLGSSPVPVLATLFLLSYAKVLHTIIAALSPTILYYPFESRVVWVWDANVPLLMYIPLVTVALLFLLFIFLPFTLFLTLGQWLQPRSHFCLLSWVRNPKLKAILDSYHAPYKPKHRYWPGLLLLVRCALFLVFSFNLRDDISINLLATSLTTLGIPVVFGLSGMAYKKWCMNALELSFFLNLGILTVATYHVNRSGGNQAVVIYISVGISFITFLGILAYHIYLQIKLKMQSFQRNRYLQGRRNLCYENGEDGYQSLELVPRVSPTRTVLEYCEFRSPLELLESN